MTTQILTWILTIVGLTGFFLAGRKIWWAWYVNIANQLIWFAYAVITQQWAFLIGVAVYTVVFTQNAIKWTRDRHKTDNWEHGESIGEVTELKETAAGLSMHFKITDKDFDNTIRKMDLEGISILGDSMTIKKRRWYHDPWNRAAFATIPLGVIIGVLLGEYLFWR